MAVMYIKDGPACSAALWHTGHAASVSRRGHRVWGRSDLVWSADGVYRKEESGRSSVVGSVHAGLPAMWPMWDHVTVLPAFARFAGAVRKGPLPARGVRVYACQSRIPIRARDPRPRGCASRCEAKS